MDYSKLNRMVLLRSYGYQIHFKISLFEQVLVDYKRWQGFNKANQTKIKLNEMLVASSMKT